MLKKVLNVIILIPAAIVLIVLSIANRAPVTLALNPFRPDDQVLSLTMPFFVFLFFTLMIGIVIGGVATWFSQSKYRKRARNEAHEAVRWHAEAERQRDRANDVVRQTSPAASSVATTPKP